MAVLTVDPTSRTLAAFGQSFACTIGRNGACAAVSKREGDGRTPIGRWSLRGVLVRSDRLRLRTALPWRVLRADDGWCDDPGDPAYNRAVRLPYPASAERLWRDDDAYDAVVVLGHNDSPPVAAAGSAIFLHVLPSYGVTAGCIALARPDLVGLLPLLSPGDVLDVVDPEGHRP